MSWKDNVLANSDAEELEQEPLPLPDDAITDDSPSPSGNNTNTVQEENPIDKTLIDRHAIRQVLGCLMLNPSLLDEYHFEIDDFCLQTYKLLYGIINNLYAHGANKIDQFAISAYCEGYKDKYEFLKADNGLTYAMDCAETAQPENFTTYYERIKKLSYLRYLISQGCEGVVLGLYDYTLTNPEEQDAELEKFDKFTLDELIGKVETGLVLNPRMKYTSNAGQVEFNAGDGLREQKEKWKQKPDFGLPLQSEILTSIARGARRKKIYIRSSASGGGKTRLGVADMANLSVPQYYDTDMNKWVYHSGMLNPACVIETELEKDEVQSMVIAYVSGVNEEHIRTGKYLKGEEDRVDKAIEYIEQSPLKFVVIRDFSVTEIVNIIKKYKREYGVNYFYFDYIQMSQSLIMESAKITNGMRMREDQLIFLAVDRLKNLAKDLNVFILSASQLNGTYKDATQKDETLLRSAKSMADRIDLGEISLPPSVAELKAVEDIIRHQIGMKTPNMVRSIYKCRGGKFVKIKIWQYVDLGTCRSKDLFVTNYDNVLIDVPITKLIAGEPPEENEALEEILNQNSVDLDTANVEELYTTMNPDVDDNGAAISKETYSQPIQEENAEDFSTIEW